MVPITELLSEHNLFRTTHLDEARSEVARVFCPHGLTTTNKDEQLNTVHNRVTLGDVTLNYLDYGAEVHITPGELNSFYLNLNMEKQNLQLLQIFYLKHLPQLLLL